MLLALVVVVLIRQSTLAQQQQDLEDYVYHCVTKEQLTVLLNELKEKHGLGPSTAASEYAAAAHP